MLIGYVSDERYVALPDVLLEFESKAGAFEARSRAIDKAISSIINAREPEHYPVRPAGHCRMCNFLRICTAGSNWVGREKARTYRR